MCIATFEKNWSKCVRTTTGISTLLSTCNLILLKTIYELQIPDDATHMEGVVTLRIKSNLLAFRISGIEKWLIPWHVRCWHFTALITCSYLYIIVSQALNWETNERVPESVCVCVRAWGEWETFWMRSYRQLLAGEL